jgi:hypothetical protein
MCVHNAQRGASNVILLTSLSGGRFRQRGELDCRRDAACAEDDAGDGAGGEAGQLRRAVPGAAGGGGGARVRLHPGCREALIRATERRGV